MDQERRWRTRTEFVTIVMAIFIVTLAVNLQVPLYQVYAEVAGYRQGLVSVTFAAYVAGLIPVLFMFGGLADRSGNKVTLLLGLGFALAGHVAIIALPTMRGLVVTRLLQGISIGLSLSAGTAYLAELQQGASRAARLSSGAVTLGLGSGGLLTSASPRYHSGLVPLSYYVTALATVACILVILRFDRAAGNRHKPMVRPPLIDKRTLPFSLGLFFSWSLTGIILSSIPAALAANGHANWSGLAVFVAIVPGLLVQLGRQVRSPTRLLRTGYGLVCCAVTLLAVATHYHSTSLLLIACALSGFSSFGFTYIGGLTGILLARSDERARAVSGYYLGGYLGFGVPCIAVGYLTQQWGLDSALIGYAAAAVVGACVGWAIGRIRRTAHADNHSTFEARDRFTLASTKSDAEMSAESLLTSE